MPRIMVTKESLFDSIRGDLQIYLYPYKEFATDRVFVRQWVRRTMVVDETQLPNVEYVECDVLEGLCYEHRTPMWRP